MNRLAIFDCDGTLVDSGATIHRALRATFEQAGLHSPSPAECRRVIGLSLVEAFATLLPDAPDRVGDLVEAYKLNFHRMRGAGEVDEPLFDGIIELLDALEANGWLLAVATGKSDRGLRHCLESHGLHARFISLQTADRHPSKPHPSMVLQAMADAGSESRLTAVIGDTSFDMAMAKAAGAAAYGAGWGYHDGAELLAAGADAVAEHPSELIAMLAAQEAA